MAGGTVPQGDNLTFTTESGTTYRLTGKTVTRIGGDPLRRDGQTLRLFEVPAVIIGAPVVMALEPLADDADVTFRVTTPVVSVEEE